MNLDDALRLIAARSPNNVQNAVRALRTAQRRPNARPVQYVLEQALRDPLAEFTAQERSAIAALLGDTSDARTADIRARVTADEKAQAERIAAERGMTVSEVIRHAFGLS